MRNIKLMKTISIKGLRPTQTKVLGILLALGALAAGGCGAKSDKPAVKEQASASAPKLLDDYSDAKRNQNGLERLLIDDKTAGSQSRATMKCENGVLSVSGELIPGRGAPAFISVASVLAPEGKPQDMTGYEGVRLRVKVLKGGLSVQVATSVITNYDFHASAPIAGQGGDFQEVRIPFKTMRRAWSEQTALDLKTVTSVNLVAFALARDTFAYEVDEIGFY